MDLFAAVVVGTLLWLLGPGRRLWPFASTRAVPNKRKPAARPPELPARESSAPRRVPQPRVASLPSLHGAPPLAAALMVEPELVSELDQTRPHPAHAAEPRARGKVVHMPISLGVVLLLQAAAFVLLCVLGALGYVSLELKGRRDTRSVELSLTREVAELEVALSSTRRTLDSLQRSLAREAPDPVLEASAPAAELSKPQRDGKPLRRSSRAR